MEQYLNHVYAPGDDFLPTSNKQSKVNRGQRHELYLLHCYAVGYLGVFMPATRRPWMEYAQDAATQLADIYPLMFDPPLHSCSPNSGELHVSLPIDSHAVQKDPLTAELLARAREGAQGGVDDAAGDRKTSKACG